MLLTSRNNPTVKKLLSLQEKKFRLEYGEYLVEGEKPVKEAVSDRMPVTALFLSESVQKKGEISAVDGVPLYTLPDELFEKVSTEKSPQGAIACLRLPDMTARAPKKSCLLLDGVSDPGNMGTIIRTANAAGYDEIYLLGCTDPYSPKAVRASMSGIFHVQLYKVTEENLQTVMAGVPLIAADLNGENIFTFTPPEKFCLCIGNEGHGISELTKRLKNHTITIPMRKTQESLNAGVSAAICMYFLKNGELRQK